MNWVTTLNLGHTVFIIQSNKNGIIENFGSKELKQTVHTKPYNDINMENGGEKNYTGFGKTINGEEGGGRGEGVKPKRWIRTLKEVGLGVRAGGEK